MAIGNAYTRISWAALVLGVLLIWTTGGSAEKMTTGDAETDAAIVELQEKAKGVKTCSARVSMVSM